jgi:hypothetical protein
VRVADWRRRREITPGPPSGAEFGRAGVELGQGFLRVVNRRNIRDDL